MKNVDSTSSTRVQNTTRVFGSVVVVLAVRQEMSWRIIRIGNANMASIMDARDNIASVPWEAAIGKHGSVLVPKDMCWEMGGWVCPWWLDCSEGREGWCWGVILNLTIGRRWTKNRDRLRGRILSSTSKWNTEDDTKRSVSYTCTIIVAKWCIPNDITFDFQLIKSICTMTQAHTYSEYIHGYDNSIDDGG